MMQPEVLHFILTNRCNLRCVYCPEGTHPQGFYADLSDAQFEEIFAYVVRNGIREVGLAYYGELTIIPGWWKKARRLLDAGVDCQATTNAHLLWSPDEVATLARFKTIIISLDSYDEMTVAKVRKKTSVARIVHNYHLVRSYCIENQIPAPHIVWSGVLTRHVVHHLPRFVAFAASNGVKDLRMNEVQLYDVAEQGLNIISLADGEFQIAVEAIDRAIEMAKRLALPLHLEELPRIRARQAGEGSAPLLARATVVGPSKAFAEAPSVPEGTTRDCQCPTLEMYLDPKGNVYTCSNRGTVMGVANTVAELEAVYDNQSYQDIRASLRKGGAALDPACASCAQRPLTPVEGHDVQLSTGLGDLLPK